MLSYGMPSAWWWNILDRKSAILRDSFISEFSPDGDVDGGDGFNFVAKNLLGFEFCAVTLFSLQLYTHSCCGVVGEEVTRRILSPETSRILLLL